MLLEDFEFLQKNGFKLLPYGLAKSKMEAHLIAKHIGYPVALKVVSKEILHKTDVGGVKVGIKNDQSLSLSYDEIIENTKNYKVEGILVQKMARKGIELIIGGKKDTQFGHMIIIGLGGVFVEVFRDITARLCPITGNDVEEMIEELRAHPIIKGTRGQKGIHIPSLKKLMKNLCKTVLTYDIKEIDLNPVVFDNKGYDIVDVRIIK